jgi:hypothetical protein
MRLSRDLFEHYVAPSFVAYQSKGQGGFLHRNDYIEAKKLLLENPFQEINTSSFRNQVDQNFSNSTKRDQTKAKKKLLSHLHRRQAIQSLESEESKIHLPFI